jgi:TRAP-type transport system periplasmic protein
MNRRLSRGIFLGAVAAPIGTAASRAGTAETYTMRFSTAEDITSLQGLTASRFAAAAYRRSNGQLKIEIYPHGQLARQQETIDGLTTGVIDFTMISTAFLVQLFPQFQIFNLPFLFKNDAAGYRVLDGPIAADVFAELESKGIVGLGRGIGGFKDLETNKAVTVPEDMKGLRVRIQNGAVYAATYQALGAIPVTIDSSEAYAALSQHTADAIDFTLDEFTTGKFYTVVKHVAMSNHIFSPNPLMGSKRKIDALPPVLQRIVREEGKAIVSFWRSLHARQIVEDIQLLKKNGVVFTEIQYPAFRKEMDSVYAALQAKLGGDLVDRISRAASAG